MEEVKKNFQFINSMYVKYYEEKTVNKGRIDEYHFNEFKNDYIILIYRDNDTGEKKFTINESPKFSYYQAIDKNSIDHQISFIEKNKVERVRCRYLQYPVKILKDFYTMNFKDESYRQKMIEAYDIKVGKRGAFEDLIKRMSKKNFDYSKLKTYDYNFANQIKYIFNSDMNINDYYKAKFLDKYECENPYFHKSYFDIEVDGISITGFPDQHDALCPINAITYVDERDKESYTFLLRNKKIKEIDNLEKDLKKFKKELKEFIDEEFDYKLYFYDKEIDLIKAFFDIVNEKKSDFCLAWNINFDMITIINRIIHLGYDPAEIMCHPDFPKQTHVCKFHEDRINQKYSEKSENLELTSYTVFLDQLLVYASLRKGIKERESYSLNDVAKDEINDNKLDYTDTSNIKTLPYDDYRMFVKYNIKDVHLLYRLEKKNNDVDLLYGLADVTRTRIDKCMKKTVSLKNLATKFYYDQGYIIGNNHNVNAFKEKSEQTEKFEGALVAIPNLNSHNGMEINGQRSMYLYKYVVDFDLSSLYPSIIISSNIDASTQYGRVLFVNCPPTKEYDRGGEFLDIYETEDLFALGSKFYNLPDGDEWIKLAEEEFKNG